MSGDIIKIYLYIQIAVLLTDPRLDVSTGPEWSRMRGWVGNESNECECPRTTYRRTKPHKMLNH